jgi:hypothetical protein
MSCSHPRAREQATPKDVEEREKQGEAWIGVPE